MTYRKRYGKLHPILWGRIQALRPDDHVRVAFFLDVPQGERVALSADATLGDTVRAERLMERRYQQTTLGVTAPFSEAIRGSTPNGFVSTSLGSPFVVADLLASDVALWANHISVLEVYWLPEDPQIKPKLLHNVHQRATGLDLAHSNFTGTGEGVTIYEFGRLTTKNAHRPVLTPLNSAILSGDPLVVEHTTSVAGILKTDQPTCEPGYKPTGSIFLTGQEQLFFVFRYPELLREAIEAGSRVHSFSQGGSSQVELTIRGPEVIPDGKIYPLGRLLDDAVINRQVSVTAGVGNSRNDLDAAGKPAFWAGGVFDPASAYQVIGVGGMMTAGTDSLADDTIYSLTNSNEGSSFVNPAGFTNDREKPELVAPALVPSINDQAIPLPQFSIFSGTSMAAPAVAGGASLLMQSRPQLRVWPEAIRSALIAGAFHNIEGRAQRSEHDGAGSIRLEKALEAAVQTTVGTVPGDCPSIPKIVYSTLRTYQSTSRRQRVAIAFDSPTNYPDYSLQSAADLDLLVWRTLPNGNDEFVGSSQTWSGTFESVEFTPSVPGIYRIEIARFRCDASPRYFALSFASE
jgi:hypothetical protein